MDHTPKNIMELEKKKAEQLTTYEGAEGALLGMWDEHPNQGIVMSVGKGRNIDQELFIPNELKPGDHIYYRGKTGEPIVVNKKLYWAIKEYDVFAIVKKQ
jgi:co-chaperonin GroES (HSP10)